jgi:hypothetical protein
MTDEIKPDATQATTQDAQLTAENMTAGKEKMPSVDVDADYAAAQQFSVSDIDRTPEGAEAANKATAHQFDTTTPSEIKSEAPSTGDPSDYMAMAKDIGAPTGAAGNVDDDLIQKALEKGQPGK